MLTDYEEILIEAKKALIEEQAFFRKAALKNALTERSRLLAEVAEIDQSIKEAKEGSWKSLLKPHIETIYEVDLDN